MRATVSTKSWHTWYIDIALLLCFFSVLFFFALGARPLFIPDEGRYAEIAREMVVNHDFITPFLNGIKYFEKPVLFYWLSAFAIKIFGLNLWAIRSVNAGFGVFGCLATYYTARKLYDRKTAILAALILGSSTLYFIMARMITLDLTVTVFLSCSLYAFILGVNQPIGNVRRYFLWLAFIFAAFAVLTKGLIGILFPCIIVGLWILFSNNWRVLRHLYLPSSIIIFFIIATPWHFLVQLHNPEFFHFYFIEQHFLRYTTREVGHYQPSWFFIPYLILGMFPWTGFLVPAIRDFFSRRQQCFFANELFFLLWAVVIFLFFSFSKSKLIPYILPIFPALSIIIAHYLAKSLSTTTTTFANKIAVLINFFIATIIAIVLFLLPFRITLPSPEVAKFYLTLSAVTLVVGAMLSAAFMLREKLLKSLVTSAVYNSIALLFIFVAMPAIDTRSIEPLAQTINQKATHGEEVIAYNFYYQDLPFYLRRKISVLNWRNELTFGMQHQSNHDWMIDDEIFWQRWHGKKTVFMMMSKEAYKNILTDYPDEKFIVIDENIVNILLTNR